MIVVFAPRAQADLEELLSHVRAQDPRTAEIMANAIDQAIDRCAHQPLVGTATSRKLVYRMPLRKFGVTLFYRVRPRRREIEFIRIVRGSRVVSLTDVPRN